MVVIQNPASIDSRHLYAKVKLPNKNFKVQKWQADSAKFVDAPSDILEQHHFNYEQKEFTDYEMFVPGEYSAGQLSVLKVMSISEAEKEEITKKEEKQKSLSQESESKTQLSVLGIGPSNDILFQYTNKDQAINQTFGVNLKYYKGHVKIDKDDF